MKNERTTIESRFRSDLSKVLGLIGLYQSHAVGVYNHQQEQFPDLLRAAVVLLHASLEDLFRSLAEWKLPKASAESLERIPLAGREKDLEKFTLVELAEFRGKSVDEVISRSVVKYLEKSNHNHPGDLAEILKKIGVEVKIQKELRDKLAAMMSRRHWIAHRVDRDLLEDVDPNKPQLGLSISLELVIEWKNAVTTVGEAVLEKL